MLGVIRRRESATGMECGEGSQRAREIWAGARRRRDGHRCSGSGKFTGGWSTAVILPVRLIPRVPLLGAPIVDGWRRLAVVYTFLGAWIAAAPEPPLKRPATHRGRSFGFREAGFRESEPAGLQAATDQPPDAGV